jgi:hypothetical protein
MMQNRSEYSAEEYNEQAYKTFRLKDVYAEVTGLDFIFEVSCTFDSETCNLRRKADKGVNHSHEVLIELPTKINHHTYEEAMRLREELLDLGILPSTGVVGSIEKRVEILRAKLAEHNEKMTRIQVNYSTTLIVFQLSESEQICYRLHVVDLSDVLMLIAKKRISFGMSMMSSPSHNVLEPVMPGTYLVS